MTWLVIVILFLSALRLATKPMPHREVKLEKTKTTKLGRELKEDA